MEHGVAELQSCREKSFRIAIPRRRITVLSLLLCFSASLLLQPTPLSAADSRKGVLILAHGGSETWNASVRDAVQQAALPYPTDIAFGMGMMPHEVMQIDTAIHRLAAQGVTELLVVPLLISSHSEVYRQYEYLLALRRKSPWPHHTPAPLAVPMPVRLGSPLEAHPYVAEIVLDRARALSKDPAREIVVLVAHGPNNDRDNDAWLANMRTIAHLVQAQGHFADVVSQTLRDDASWWTRHHAAQALRRLVAHENHRGRVLVVPLLMARGGIEHKIPACLRGLSFVYTGETLLPHARIATWIRDTVTELSHALAEETSPDANRSQSAKLGQHGEREKPRSFWYN